METNAKHPLWSHSRYGVGILGKSGTTPRFDRAGRRPWQRDGYSGIGARAISLAALLLLVMSVGVAGARDCKLIVPFEPANFSDPTTITNTYLPRTVGTERILVRDDGGTIVTRVTNKTKVIKFGPDPADWVNTRVIWELDFDEDGEVVEEELRFEAQGDTITVWNVGELTKEVEDEIVLFESTWIAGYDDGMAGHLMLAEPTEVKTHGRKWYLQAKAPDIIEDCGKVWDTDVPVEILEDPEDPDSPIIVECDALQIRESSNAFDHEGGHQFKYFCPGEGLVLIDGVGGPEGQEVAQLAAPVRLADCSELTDWADAVVALETEAYNDPDGPKPYRDPLSTVFHLPVAGPDCP